MSDDKFASDLVRRLLSKPPRPKKERRPLRPSGPTYYELMTALDSLVDFVHKPDAPCKACRATLDKHKDTCPIGQAVALLAKAWP